MAKHQNIALFVPHQGCPQDCVFCNQARITGQEREERLTRESVQENIEQQLATLSPEDRIEIAFFGGSFTGLPRSYQTMLLETAKAYVDQGKVQGIRLSTRPDYINQSILDYLANYAVTTIELGTQSMVQEVLDRTKRGHTVEQTIKASQLIKQHPQFQLGLQLLPGLPGDTLERSIYTAEQVAYLQPDFVRIYPTLVIKGTELEWDFALGRFIPLSLEQAVEWVAKMWLIFLKQDIPVIRMGLQPSEDLREEGTVIAGPFHPAFRQLVEGYLFEHLLHLIKDKHADLLQVMIHPADETALRGRKGIRWRNFSQALHQPVQLLLDRNLKRGQLLAITAASAESTYSFRQLSIS